MIEPSPKNRTPVLVDGCRVPFRRSGTDYTDLIAYDLARSVLKGLLTRSELEPYHPLVRVSEILKEPHSNEVFCGYETINHDFTRLEAVYKNQKSDWKAALENIKGVYLIADNR